MTTALSIGTVVILAAFIRTQAQLKAARQQLAETTTATQGERP